MTERTLRISARMAEEIQQWASDELSQWPRDTAYAADLESLLAQLTAEQPAPDAVAEAAKLADQIEHALKYNAKMVDVLNLLATAGLTLRALAKGHQP